MQGDFDNVESTIRPLPLAGLLIRSCRNRPASSVILTHVFRSSLCNLCVLCVSVVNEFRAKTHTPLMLQTVLGLDAVAIGRALLVAPKTIGQRLVRAKTKIRQTRIAFEIPTADQIPERLKAVLNAIYAAYGNSWEDASGADQRVTELGDEAIGLARVLREQIPDDPEVRGLLALMLYCEARRPARRSAGGRFVPLSEQDPKDWRMPMIDEAEGELAVAFLCADQGDIRSKLPFNQSTLNVLTQV